MAKYTFQIIAGDHTQLDVDGVVRTYSWRGTVNPDARPYPYNGKLIESDVDLAAKFGRNKFVLVGSGDQVQASPWQLDPLARRPNEPEEAWRERVAELVKAGQAALGVKVEVVPPPPELVPVSPTKLAEEKGAKGKQAAKA